MKIPGYIYDRYNQRYAVEVVEDSGLSFYIKLKDGGSYIGQMLVSFLPDGVMILEDLFIRSDTDAPEKWSPGRKTGRMSAGILSKLVSGAERQGKRKQDSVRNYRNRGLGSELIKLVLDLAAEREGKVIFGSLIREDIAINPQLLEWYMHRGFTVSAPFKNCIPDAVTYIRFDLPQGTPGLT